MFHGPSFFLQATTKLVRKQVNRTSFYTNSTKTTTKSTTGIFPTQNQLALHFFSHSKWCSPTTLWCVLKALWYSYVKLWCTHSNDSNNANISFYRAWCYVYWQNEAFGVTKWCPIVTLIMMLVDIGQSMMYSIYIMLLVWGMMLFLSSIMLYLKKMMSLPWGRNGTSIFFNLLKWCFCWPQRRTLVALWSYWCPK